MSRPPNAHRVEIHPLLPARTRILIATQLRIDHVCARLVDHGHYRAATWLWRTCRLW